MFSTMPGRYKTQRDLDRCLAAASMDSRSGPGVFYAPPYRPHALQPPQAPFPDWEVFNFSGEVDQAMIILTESIFVDIEMKNFKTNDRRQ